MYPGIVMGVQAILGTFWWLLSWFMYINHDKNFKLRVEGEVSWALAWAFDNLSNTQYGWIAASVMTTFFVHMCTSVIEFISWFWWLAGDGRLFGWWSSTIGWWGSVVVYPIPVIFAIFQLAFKTEMGGFEGNYYQEVGEYTVWVIVMAGIVWLFSGLVHIIYGARLLAQINPLVNKPCMCDNVKPLDPLSTSEEKAAYEALQVAICYEKCPPAAPFCPLKKGKDQTYEDYLSACNALKAKAATEFAKRPVPEAPAAAVAAAASTEPEEDNENEDENEDEEDF